MKIVEVTYKEAHITYQDIDICGSLFVDISFGTMPAIAGRLLCHIIYYGLKIIQLLYWSVYILEIS